MSNHQFSIVQGRAVSDLRVTNSQFRTLAALGMYADKNGWCFPKQNTVGEDVGKTQQRVSEDISALAKLGYVQIVPQYDPITNARMQNKYRLLHDTPTENVEKNSVTPTENVEKNSVDNVPLNVPYNTASDENQSSAEPKIQKPANQILPIEWQIVSRQKVLVQQDEKKAKMMDAANLIATGTGMDYHEAYGIALAFMETRGIIIPQSKIKGQRKAVKEMIEMGVLPNHVQEATEKLMNAKTKMTVVDLFSVSKTAIDLANQSDEYKGVLDGV